MAGGRINFNALTPAQQQVIVKIGLVVAAIGPLLVIIGKLLTSVGTIMTWAPKIVNGVSSIMGIGSKLIRETDLITAICVQMDWEQFDEGRFEAEIEKVVVTNDEITLMRQLILVTA